LANKPSDLPHDLMERIRKRKCFADKDLEEVSQSIRSNEKTAKPDCNLLIDQKFQENFLNFFIEQQLKQYITNPFFVNSINYNQNKFQNSQSKEAEQTEKDSELIDEQPNCLINYSTLFSYLMNASQINSPFGLPDHQNSPIDSEKQVDKPISVETNKNEAISNVKTKSSISSKITNFSVEALLSI